jgi:glycosyltransferase involved in cell wall biosynthesis
VDRENGKDARSKRMAGGPGVNISRVERPHVVYLIDSLVRGGAEQSLLTLAPHYIRRGIRLDVAYLHERNGLRDALRSVGVKTFSLAGGGGRLGWIRRARRLLEAGSPHLVHTTLFEADIVGRIAGYLVGLPVVSSLVTESYGPSQLQDPVLRRWKVRGAQAADAITARRVVRFHAIAEHVAEVMAARLRIPRERIDVVPRGREPGDLGLRTPDRRARARLHLGMAADEIFILAAGRQEYPKGLDLLIEAFPKVLAELPSARLMIAGREGSQTGMLRAGVTRLGLKEKVEFIGSRLDLPELLCGADLFVLPSRWEGLGGVLLEAMALEAPIVANDLPSIREILINGIHARLVPPQQPDALATAIVTTLRDGRRAAEFARRARSRFLERFTAASVADQMTAFYQRALADGWSRRVERVRMLTEEN